MKNVLLVCIFAGAVALLSGCMMVSFNGVGARETVQGTGPRVSQSYSYGAFTSVDIAIPATIMYRNSATSQIVVYMQENLFEYLVVTIEGGHTRLASTRSFRTDTGNTPRVYIYTPYLDTINLQSAVTAENWDTLVAETLNLTLSGAVNGQFDLEVETLHLNASGAININLNGSAATAHVLFAGAGDLDAENLQINNAHVNIAGAGNAVMAVSDMLDVTISGVGRLEYIGSPQVSQTIAGVGRVSRRE